MKLKLNKLALAASIAMVAGGAQAATPFATPDVVAHMSSASAVRDTFLRMMRDYCDTTVQRNIYEFGASANVRAYECQFKPTTDPVVGNELAAKGLGGKKALVYHTVQVNTQLGGSIVGVMPIYRAIPMEYVRVEAACTANGTEAISGFAKWNCANHDWAASDFGASDTEPANFSGFNLASGAVVPVATNPSIKDAATVGLWKSAVSLAELSQADSKAMFGVGFGVAATKVAKTAGLSNLSRNQLQALLSGNVEDWGAIKSTMAGTAVKVCRRTQGSGTQATFNAFANGFPCLSSALPIADATATGPIFGTLTVVENATTGDVKTCLTNANAAGEAAIGILSLENNEAAAGWEFLALDGTNPFDAAETTASPDGVADRIHEELIANGTYPLFAEETMQWRTVNYTSPVTGYTVTAPTGLRLALGQLIRDNAGNPEIAKTLPGVLSLPSWWQNATYAGARGTATELAQGISNYTKGGQVCALPNYQP